MNQHKFSLRVTVLVLIIALVGGIFSVRLYDIQVTQAAQAQDTPADSYTYSTRVTAARGQILDRNGKVLVGNRASYNIIIVKGALMNSDDPNDSLRRLTNLCVELGLQYADHFPVTMEKPYAYTTENYSDTWNGYFNTFLSKREWDTDISAPQLIKRLRERYNLPQDWSEEEVRRVISLRYELELRYYTSLPTYVLLEDVDAMSLAAITELNIPGVNVEIGSEREYYTTYAAHIIGMLGRMNAEEWENYKEKGYYMDAYVGKDGFELAFEEQLHGTDGRRVTTISQDGTVLEEYYSEEPVAGQNVEITIDIDIQKAAEDTLASYIENLRENGANGTEDGKDVEGAAVVVMKVKTGEVLACASYPTFELENYRRDYNEILEQEFDPLYNRALQATYPPGSTFKMVTTIAAIDSGKISPYTTITDKGEYTRFEDSGYIPRCLLYKTSNGTQTHGDINVIKALSVSCNYFFYEVGWMTGIRAIDAVAKPLGLGEKTGIELYERKGYRSNPETKEELGEQWYGGDLVATAIGQSENRFTPIQLCSYTAALANRGTRYRATFLRRVLSSDYSTLISENHPQILSQLDISDAAYMAYYEGMRMAATSGTASLLLKNYPVAVCAKTGTAQHGSGGSDHVSMVLFAPAENPEIAITIYVEKGATTGALGQIAIAVMDVYFSEADDMDTVPAENVLN